MLSGNVTTQITVAGSSPVELPLYRTQEGNVLLIESVKLYADPVDDTQKLAGSFPVAKYSFSVHLKENGITRADFTTLPGTLKPAAYRRLANYQKIVLEGTISVQVFPKENIPDTDPLVITIEVLGHELPKDHPLVKLYK